MLLRKTLNRTRIREKIWVPQIFQERGAKGEFHMLVKEWSFLMSGTRAEGNCPGCENCWAISLRGTKIFRPNLRNATFRTCIVMYIY